MKFCTEVDGFGEKNIGKIGEEEEKEIEKETTKECKLLSICLQFQIPIAVQNGVFVICILCFHSLFVSW